MADPAKRERAALNVLELLPDRWAAWIYELRPRNQAIDVSRGLPRNRSRGPDARLEEMKKRRYASVATTSVTSLGNREAAHVHPVGIDGEPQ